MSILTLIGLPLGNIEDITLRAMKGLFASDVILAEDTRNYLKIKSIIKERFPEILEKLQVNIEARPELISYREQNHKGITPKIIEKIREGKSVGLITDAGLPAISDPGFRLVSEVLQAGLEVDVIPGPTAVDTALVISGLPTDKFTFLGFLPRERGKIKKIISSKVDLNTKDPETIIYYESPYRVLKTLEIIAEDFDQLNVAACNDLTKKFQRVLRGNIKDVISELKEMKIQGEWVVVIRLNQSQS